MPDSKKCDNEGNCETCNKKETQLTLEQKKEHDEFIKHLIPDMEKVFKLYTGIIEVVQQYKTNHTELVILLKWLCDYEDYLKFTRRINDIMPQYVEDLIRSYMESIMNSPSKKDTSPIKGEFIG